MRDLRSYFLPLTSESFSSSNFQSTQIGHLIDFHSDDHFPSLQSIEIAIFNIPEFEGSNNSAIDKNCKIRNAFYNLHIEESPKIVDFGFMKLMPTRRESFNIIQLVCEELISKDIIPVIIGGGHDVSYAIYKAYSALNKFISIAMVDNQFDLGLEDDNLSSLSHLGKIIQHKPSHLFHYVNLGYQTYFTSPLAVDFLNNMHFDIFRLGNLKADILDVEPIMRNIDFLSFDISSISNAYAPANVYSTPNGLTGEESCKILRYAGLSDRVSSVGFFEYNQVLDNDNQTAFLISQMIWYFLNGYTKRKNEINPNLNNCVKYTVSFDEGKNEIVFYKSKSSGRWWMGVPFVAEKADEGESLVENYFVACSYSDYELANQGEIPSRWLKTYHKLSS